MNLAFHWALRNVTWNDKTYCAEHETNKTTISW